MALFSGTANNDTINGDAPSPGISAGVTSDPSGIPYPMDADDTLYGFGGDDLLASAGGNDTILTGTGTDTAHGGDGNDTITADGDDGGDFLYGDAGNDTISGNTFANAGTGANKLYGGEGNDILVSGQGNDTLDGGSGADTMWGGDGDDLYIVDSLSDVAREYRWDFDSYNGTSGYDTVRSSVTFHLVTPNDYHAATGPIEALYLTGTDFIDGYGDEFTDVISGNDAANVLDRGNVLIGNGGNDTLSRGGVMIGGAGDDTYYSENSYATITEAKGGGTDTAYIDGLEEPYTLGAHIENLVLTGQGQTGRGNWLANHITGGAYTDFISAQAGADTLDGGSGDDVLIGGTGADTLIGGAGNDQFRFDTAASSTPTIRDVIREGSGGVPAFEASGSALGDSVDVTRIDANTDLDGRQHFVFGTSKEAGHLWVATSATMTLINGNTDADPDVEFRVAIDDGTVAASSYTAADFIL